MTSKQAQNFKNNQNVTLGDAASAGAAFAGTAAEQNKPTEKQPIDKKPVVDDLGRSYGTGRRKDSSARVWVKPGKGKITVNGKDIVQYFGRPVLRMIINQVFEVTGSVGHFDVVCTVKGGGLSGQAGAIRHGIARALDNFNPVIYHANLRAAGFLTRDSRAVERKKPGRKKARKSFQFSKR